MWRKLQLACAGAGAAFALAACGGGGDGGNGNGGGPGGGAALVSYQGTTGVFAAWVDPVGGSYAAAPTGSYAGKKQILRGTVDFQTGQDLGQAAGVEVYKGSDGHVYLLDLTATAAPAPQQLSSEAAATVDDACSLAGTQVAGANIDYAGVYFTADLQAPTNSTYVYRLPGSDGVCNTADDVFHAVKTGMGAADAPLVVPGMPVATVRSAAGGITGFVLKSGSELVLVDGNFLGPVELGSFAAPINVAVALPVGTTQGYPTGQLYDVDGSLVYVDYAGHTVSSALYAIPGWLPTNAGALFAASPAMLYFAINTPAAGATPASAAIYALPANGSAPPALVDTQAGHVTNLVFPVQGASLLYGLASASAFAVRNLPAGAPSAQVVAQAGSNGGTFLATATTVYYTAWLSVTDNTALTVTRSGTSAGIVALDGTVLQAPLAQASFVSGGEQQPWPADNVTTATPYVTLFEVQGMGTVSVLDPANGYTYTQDAVSGGQLVAIDAGSNQVVTVVGTLPQGSAVALSGTFRSVDGTGFLEAYNPASTEDPATRDLYLFNDQTAGSLTRVTFAL
jgi:hypothetical protein